MTSGNSSLFFLIHLFCDIAYLINRNLRDLPRKRCSFGPVIKCGLKNQNSSTSIKFTRTLKQQIFFFYKDLKDNKWQSSDTITQHLWDTTQYKRRNREKRYWRYIYQKQQISKKEDEFTYIYNNLSSLLQHILVLLKPVNKCFITH